jgi:two-component system response regulator DesR
MTMTSHISPNEQADPTPVKILLADDEPKVRSALRLLLEQETSWKIVAEVEEMTDLLAAAAASCPDVILLDWELPGINGEKSISNLRACCDAVKIVALSSQVGAGKSACQADVDAFVSKSDPPETVRATLHSLEHDQTESCGDG